MKIESEHKEDLSFIGSVKIEQKAPFLTKVFLPGSEIEIGLIKDELYEYHAKQARIFENFFSLSHGKVELPDGRYLLIAGQVHTSSINEPFKMSEDSDALYLAKADHGGFKFLLQYLEGQTSRHSHNGEELFHPLDYSNPSFIHNSRVNVLREPICIPAGVDHEVFSLENKPTLTIIVQNTNVEHVHKKKTDLNFLRQEAVRLITDSR